jgi:uncharacterized protein YegL
MKDGRFELVFILDRSGSMEGLEKDTIGGYNSILKEHKEQKSDAFITTVLFDDQYEIIHDRVEMKNVKLITKKEYFVRGMTALLDAVGKTINNIGLALHDTHEADRPSKVIFVIVTDGMENASKEYSHEKIKDMVQHQKEKYSWEFLFLGANIDAISTAGSMGISEDHAANFHADEKGVNAFYKASKRAVSNLMISRSVGDWKAEVDQDFESRKPDKVGKPKKDIKPKKESAPKKKIPRKPIS